MYKCAIVGASGSRAVGLAEAYAHIRRGRQVAVSSRTEDKLHTFADRFDAPRAIRIMQRCSSGSNRTSCM